MDVVALLLRPVIRGVLAEHLPGRDTDRLVRETWDDYRALSADLPHEPTAGARILLRCAAVTIALHRKLVLSGRTPDQARASVAGAMRDLNVRIIGLIDWLARLPPGDPRRPLETMLRLFRSAPFGPPAWHVRDVEAPGTLAAFDIVRCPVADYFARHDLPELCVAAFCAADQLAAQRFGVRLERKGTLAQGAPQCDFRYRAKQISGER